MAGMSPQFPYYSSQSQVGQYRSPYSQLPMAPSGPAPMQSMTSHWNLPPPSLPHPSTHHHPIMTGGTSTGGGKSKSINQNTGGLKPPKPPEKPLLPYMRYSRKMWEQFKKTEGTDLKVWEVGKIIGQKWRELSDEDKQPYFDEYESEKTVYDENMKTYKNSYAYKQYLEAKKLAERQSAQAQAAPPNYLSDLAPPPPQVIAPPRHNVSDPRLVMLQQHEEEEEDEYLTTKQVAAARYHRNHRLMAEVFNDSILPDTRSHVSLSRVDSLKLQAESLSGHQRKLEEEVRQLENKYTGKRNQFLEDAEKFRRELKRIQDNPPSSWKKAPLQLSSKDIPEQLPSAHYIKL